VIVLDTTVLVYAVGSEHPYRDPCRQLLFERHELGCFDAVLAATAQEAGAAALVSADVAYGGVPRLNHVLPDKAGVDRLLGG